jgi:hypothetical protein
MAYARAVSGQARGQCAVGASLSLETHDDGRERLKEGAPASVGNVPIVDAMNGVHDGPEVFDPGVIDHDPAALGLPLAGVAGLKRGQGAEYEGD